MSLSKLPDLLKRQICSFLDGNAIEKLELINKRTQEFLTRYKFKIHGLSFDAYADRSIGVYVMFEKDGDWTELMRIENLIKQKSKIVDCINKFRLISTIVFNKITFHDLFGLESIKAKFGNGRFDEANFFLSKNTVINFFKRFKRIQFKSGYLNLKYINDELFMVLADNGTTLIYETEDQQKVNLTDATLDSFERNLPKEIRLKGFTTKFTFGRIKQLIETALTIGMSKINWHFGTMKRDQLQATQAFVYADREYWFRHIPLRLGPIYHHSMFEITHRHKSQDEFNITFGALENW